MKDPWTGRERKPLLIAKDSLDAYIRGHEDVVDTLRALRTFFSGTGDLYDRAIDSVVAQKRGIIEAHEAVKAAIQSEKDKRPGGRR